MPEREIKSGINQWANPKVEEYANKEYSYEPSRPLKTLSEINQLSLNNLENTNVESILESEFLLRNLFAYHMGKNELITNKLKDLIHDIMQYQITKNGKIDDKLYQLISEKRLEIETMEAYEETEFSNETN